MDNIILVIVTALISGLFATIITLWWQHRASIRERKLRVFETLMSFRYKISSEESVKALNSLDAVFYNDEGVRKAYRDFLAETDKNPELNPNIGDKYIKLLEEMSKALKLKNIHWDDIKHSYYPSGLSTKENEEDILRRLQIQSASTLMQNEKVNGNSLPPTQQTQMMHEIVDLIGNPQKLEKVLELNKAMEQKINEDNTPT